MTRTALIAAIASGGLAIGASAYAAPPIAYKPVPAQVHAERTCRDQGIHPNGAAWELCLAHVTRAYEWGEPGLAGQLANAANNARESCLQEGHRVESTAFRDCIDQEIDARSDLLILGDDQSGENVAKAQ